MEIQRWMLKIELPQGTSWSRCLLSVVLEEGKE